MRRFVVTFAVSCVCAALLAQQQPPAPPAETSEDPGFTIKVPVTEIAAPVLVIDADGSYMSGLRASQFHLFDNGKEQNIRQIDVSFRPISLVIAIQSNAAVEKILPQVNRVGNLIAPMILGEHGEAAVIAFDSRIRTLQDFTDDPEKITQAVKKIYPGSMSSRLVDGVEAGTRMLKNRPADRRRILLVIGEKRDLGSEARSRETLINLQLNNIMLFAVDMSRLIERLSGPPVEGRPDPLPPAMHPMPSNTPATPSTVSEVYGWENQAQFLPLMEEIYKDAKAVFKTTPLDLFAKGTGGSEYSFYSGKGLEEAIEKMGEEVHSEYILIYSPNNREEAGFHAIKVEVSAPFVKKVQTRPGYWAAADFRK